MDLIKQQFFCRMIDGLPRWGRMARSKTGWKPTGVNREPTRWIGASKYWNSSGADDAGNFRSEAREDLVLMYDQYFTGFFTELKIASLSNGIKVRRSITSSSQPFSL